MNKIIISGNLTAEPEVRYTQNNVTVASFTVAVRRRIAAGGAPTADFINCTAWDKCGEFVAKYFTKGSRIEVVGKLNTDPYVASDGRNRTKVYVYVEEVGFGGKKEET